MLSLLFFALIYVLQVQAGACTRKYYGTNDCLLLCSNKMGYPGMIMGGSRWGSVIIPTYTSQWNVTVAHACGFAGEQSNSSVTASSSISTSPATDGARQGSASTTSAQIISATISVISSQHGTSSQPPKTTLSVTSTSRSSPTPHQSTGTEPVTTSRSSQKTQKSQTQKSQKTSTASSVSATKQPSTSSSPSGSTSNNADINAFLKGHNDFRALHGADPLTWSDNLANSAQDWANNCQFKHSTSGENLAAGVGGGYDIAAAIKSWTNEASSYKSNDPQASHFTQVVWKSTTQVGCGQQQCSGIFDDSFGKALYIVCHYTVAGNVIGQFKENVQV